MSAHPLDQAIRASITNQLELGITYENTANAVLAVLDLHKPDNDYPLSGVKCTECEDAYGAEREDYPCDTVKAIADALGITP